MDLRKSNLNVAAAVETLNYQPFIISNEIQTGVAWSWIFSADPRATPPLVFERCKWNEKDWENINYANGRLRAMYDDLLDEVAQRFPNGTLLDVACNNGYFPVGAELRGMKGAGLDLGKQYKYSFDVLNDALGTKARFLPISYESYTHHLRLHDKFDVSIISAIMCHMPDPLFFLKEVARVSRKAILFWGQVVSTNSKLIVYNSPHATLSSIDSFPHGFNDNTRISRGMFKECARLLGFSEVLTIPSRSTWLTKLGKQMNNDLEEELNTGSAHEAILLMR